VHRPTDFAPSKHLSVFISGQIASVTFLRRALTASLACFPQLLPKIIKLMYISPFVLRLEKVYREEEKVHYIGVKLVLHRCNLSRKLIERLFCSIAATILILQSNYE